MISVFDKLAAGIGLTARSDSYAATFKKSHENVPPHPARSIIAITE